MWRNVCHPPAPSRADASYTCAGMFLSPLWSMTRLNGMPIQMLATVTDTSDQAGEVSQFTVSSPNNARNALTTPASLLSIQAQVDADTISGSSHGTRKSARSVVDSRKFRAKNTASARPIPYWNTSDATVNRAVLRSAVPNVG